jgi:hypothetical protein
MSVTRYPPNKSPEPTATAPSVSSAYFDLVVSFAVVRLLPVAVAQLEMLGHEAFLDFTLPVWLAKIRAVRFR